MGGNGTSAARLLAEVDAMDRRHRAERPFLMDQVGDELRASSNSKFTFKFSLFHLYMLLVSFFWGGGWGVQLRSELNSRTATGGGNGLVYPIDLPKTGEGIKIRLAATRNDPTTAVAFGARVTDAISPYVLVDNGGGSPVHPAVE